MGGLLFPVSSLEYVYDPGGRKNRLLPPLLFDEADPFFTEMNVPFL